MGRANRVVILGVFVADTAYRADRAPRMGETILGRSFKLGPGGKGSNQAVAAARLGAEVSFITRLGAGPLRRHGLRHLEGGGRRAGGDAGRRQLHRRGLHLHRGGDRRQRHHHLPRRRGRHRAGRPRRARRADCRAPRSSSPSSSSRSTAAVRGLEIARDNGVTTILNPAPGRALPDAVLALCDYSPRTRPRRRS